MYGMTVQDSPFVDFWNYNEDPLPAQTPCVTGVSPLPNIGELGQLLIYAHRSHLITFEEGNNTVITAKTALMDFTRTKKVDTIIVVFWCQKTNIFQRFDPPLLVISGFESSLTFGRILCQKDVTLQEHNGGTTTLVLYDVFIKNQWRMVLGSHLSRLHLSK